MCPQEDKLLSNSEYKHNINVLQNSHPFIFMQLSFGLITFSIIPL